MNFHRREFFTLLGGVASGWPLAARAQQRPAMPVIGVLSMGVQALSEGIMQALKEGGFVEGRNVTIIRGAAGEISRLPALAADLIGRRVDVIYAPGAPAIVAAKAATATIPIVFSVGEDPVQEGYVASLNRPGGNVTGFTGFGNQLIAKRLELLHQAVPKATVMGFLINPKNPNAGPNSNDAQAAARTHGLALNILSATSDRDFDQVFAAIAQERIGALLVGVEPFFWANAARLAGLAARHAVPALYDRRLFADAGGLMSYGTSLSESERQVGLYLGRILKGEKPADLPVVQSTKFEFVVNLKTARALGLEMSPLLVALADEVIE